MASKSSPVQESDSSSDESLVSSLSMLKSSKDIKQQVDSRLHELEECSGVQSNQKQKLKSKRGGNVESIVSKKVAWPHDSIPGGTSKGCCMTSLHGHNGFRALPETFWVKNLKKSRETMLTYLFDLI